VLYHVTEASRLERILADGLRASAPGSLYQTGYLYLTDQRGVWPWAREFASARGKAYDAAVIAIAEPGVALVSSLPYVGMCQYKTRLDIEAERLQLVHRFRAEPDERPLMLKEGWPCPTCGEPLVSSRAYDFLDCRSEACNEATEQWTRQMREQHGLWRHLPVHDVQLAAAWAKINPWVDDAPWLPKAA
jgi:hypothetical protein